MRTIVTSHATGNWRAWWEPGEISDLHHGDCEAECVGRLYGPCRQYLSGDTDACLLPSGACARGRYIIGHADELQVRIERRV